MGIFSVAAMAAVVSATLGGNASMVGDPVGNDMGCLFEPATFNLDVSAGPLLVSAVDDPRPPPSGVQGQWGQAALHPYDVMTSLGAGGSPQLPAALSLADAPAALPLSSPLAWVLAAAGLLGMLYVRRTQL